MRQHALPASGPGRADAVQQKLSGLEDRIGQAQDHARHVGRVDVVAVEVAHDARQRQREIGHRVQLAAHLGAEHGKGSGSLGVVQRQELPGLDAESPDPVLVNDPVTNGTFCPTIISAS